MKALKKILISLSLVTVLVACDSHMDFPETGMRPGHILCTDGEVLSYEDYKQTDKEAIAVIFHVKYDETTPGDSYAVYLHDLPAAQFADSLGISHRTSADMTAFDGNQNTFALFNTGGSPMGEQVFAMWRYGQSAYIGSVAQMRLLYQAKPVINRYIEQCGGEPLPDAADDCWYWTSTEVEGQTTAKAWLYSTGSGAAQETPKIQAHKVRPIVTINN